MLPFLATISRRPFERAGLRGEEKGGRLGWGRWDEREGGGGGPGSADLKADGDRGGWGNGGGAGSADLEAVDVDAGGLEGEAARGGEGFVALGGGGGAREVGGDEEGRRLGLRGCRRGGSAKGRGVGMGGGARRDGRIRG